MEMSHNIDVTALDAAHRQALEDVIGTELKANQRLIISVTEVDVTAARPAQSLSDWTSVYEGLADEQVDALDREFNTRANLSRPLP